MSESEEFDLFKATLITLAIIILILIIISIILFFIFKTNFEIYKDGIKVNNLTACCIKLKNIDYFENYSYLQNDGRTNTIIYMERKEFCFSEEENILNFDCKDITNKDLKKEWVEENSIILQENKEYKFGKYIIKRK